MYTDLLICSLHSKCHTVSWYTCNCNLIYVHKKNNVLIFMKFTNAEHHHYVHVSYINLSWKSLHIMNHPLFQLSFFYLQGWSLKHSEGFVCRKAFYFGSGKLHVNLMPLHYKVRVKVSKELYFCRSSESNQILCHS